MILHIDGERRVRRRARLCTDALRDLLLHHDRHLLERAALEQRRNRRCGDVIRQIGARDRLSVTEFLLAERGKIGFEHIAVHDLEVIVIRKCLCQNRHEGTVQLDRHDLIRAPAQLRRQAAHARADLNRVAALGRAAHLRNAARHAFVRQKVLSERFGKMESVTAQNRSDCLNIT